MKLISIALLALLLFPMTLVANDFPTQARVEYVLACMDGNGGQNYNTLYPCICSIDKIAEAMPYKVFEEAQTLTVMIKTPGERGGAFRDAPGARDLVKNFKKLNQDVERMCWVNKPASKK